MQAELCIGWVRSAGSRSSTAAGAGSASRSGIGRRPVASGARLLTLNVAVARRTGAGLSSWAGSSLPRTTTLATKRPPLPRPQIRRTYVDDAFLRPRLNYGVIIVPQQQAFVIERFGKFSDVLYAGIYVRPPGIYRIAYVHSLKERAMHVESQQAITADNVTITIDGVVYVRITDAKAASYGVSDPVYAVTQLAQTTMRSEIGKMKLDNTLQERETLNSNIVAAINRAAAEWGIECLRYEIKDIGLSQAMKDAMAQESMAERSRRAEITRSDGHRQSAINVAEGKKRAVILESEAARIDAENRARGEAEAIKARAGADAMGIEMIAMSLAQPGGEAAAKLRIADEYVRSFGKLSQESTTLIVPANAHDAAGMVSQAMAVFNTVQKSELAAVASDSTTNDVTDVGDGAALLESSTDGHSTAHDNSDESFEVDDMIGSATTQPAKQPVPPSRNN